MTDPDNTQDYYTTDENASAQPKGTIDFSSPAIPAPDLRAKQTRRNPFRKVLAWTLVIVVLVLSGIVYIRYYNPYVTDARARGYVTSVERRGIIFKTYEGEMITEQSLTDTLRLYNRDFTFTIPDEQMARELQKMQGTGRPVTVVYSRYYGMLPWRGASTTVLTAVE